MKKSGKKASGTKRFSGTGKSLDSPPQGMADQLSGRGDKGKTGDRHSKASPDGSYKGNVVGPRSKTFM